MDAKMQEQEHKPGYTISQKNAIIKYAKSHPDKIKIIQKKYNDKRWQDEKYREDKKAYMRAYYQKNREILKQRQKFIRDEKNNIINPVDPINNHDQDQEQELDSDQEKLERQRQYRREYYQKNKDKIKQRYIDKKNQEEKQE